MRSLPWIAVASLVLFACPPPTPGRDGGPDAGDASVPELVCGDTGFCVQELEAADAGGEPDGGAPYPIAAVALPDDGVAITYYHRVGSDPQGNGTYELRYREWRGGALSPAEHVMGMDGGQPVAVQRIIGLSMALRGNGQPAVAYMGGFEDAGTQAYWFQNDAYLSYRNAPGDWSTAVVARECNDAPGTTTLSNTGFLVGLHAALAFDGDTAYYAWRDCHSGNFPQQDWQGSDLEYAFGTFPNLADKRVIISADGVTQGKLGYGGHNTILVADGGVYLVGDQITSGPDGPGMNVNFFKRNADGSWAPPVSAIQAGTVLNDQLGPSFTWDPVLGFAVAVFNASTNELLYVSSQNGTTWSTPTPLVGAGSSGWYPSIAVDPVMHTPQIAYYHCDPSGGRNAWQCRDIYDELRIIAQRGVTWRDEVVDRSGGWMPRLLFLEPSGRRAVVYRDPRTWAVKIAVEAP